MITAGAVVDDAFAPYSLRFLRRRGATRLGASLLRTSASGTVPCSRALARLRSMISMNFPFVARVTLSQSSKRVSA